MVKPNYIPSVIVEAHTVLRKGLASLLDDTEFKVVATVATISEMASVSLPTTRPVLIILGIWNALAELKQAVQQVRSLSADTKVVVVAESAGPHELQELLNSGATGVIVNVSSRDVFIKALGLAFLDQEFVVMGDPLRPLKSRNANEATINETARTGVSDEDQATRGKAIQQLSQREKQILACLTRGDSNKLIARHCCIAEATVKVHLKAILRKIAVHNRTQAALWASEHRLVNESNGATRDADPLPA